MKEIQGQWDLELENRQKLRVADDVGMERLKAVELSLEGRRMEGNVHRDDNVLRHTMVTRVGKKIN